MFCNQCGNALGEGQKFCGNCGAVTTIVETQPQPESVDPTPAQPNQPPSAKEEHQPEPPAAEGHETAAQPEPPVTTMQPSEPPPEDGGHQATQPPEQPLHYAYSESFPPPEPPAKKGIGMLLKIGVPALAVVIIAVIVILSVMRSSPLAVVSRAMANNNAETMQRIEGTPFRAIELLMDTLGNGAVNVDFDYRDRWSDANGTVQWVSNTRNNDHSFAAEITSNRQTLEVEAFINRDRLAVGSRNLDNNYYGITFATFRDDLSIFGREVGLSSREMNTIIDVVELIEDVMHITGDSDTLLQQYIDLLTDFMTNLELTSERTQITSGGSNVNARKIQFIITDDDISDLLTDLIDMLSDDEHMREYFNAITRNEIVEEMFWRMQIPSYSDLMRELRDAVRDLNRHLSGEITITYFVGSRDRLLRMETEADLRMDRERVRMSSSFDFGESAQDRWEIQTSITSDNMRERTRVVWDYEDSSGRITNSMVITADGDRIFLESEWSPSNGRFTLSMDDGRFEDEITGVFRVNRDGFNLSIDNPFPRNSNEFLEFEITTQTGVRVRQIDFINMDLWDEDLLYDFEDLIDELNRNW